MATDDDKLLPVRKSRAFVYGSYRGNMMFLLVLYAVGYGASTWVHRSITIEHAQLRSPSHGINTFNSDRYVRPAWWAIAGPQFWRAIVLFWVAQTLIRTWAVAPRVGSDFGLFWALLFEVGGLVYLLLERYLFGCLTCSMPWMICQPADICHACYKSRPEFCSNTEELLVSPTRGLQVRHEWRLMVLFAIVHIVLTILMIWVLRRMGSSKPVFRTVRRILDPLREVWSWHWGLLIVATVLVGLFLSVAVRTLSLEHLYVRSPSLPNSFRSDRFGTVWYAHAIAVLVQPLVVYTGFMMLLNSRWNTATADSHRLALMVGIVDNVIRVALYIWYLQSCNGTVWPYNNPCHSPKLCCLRFDDFPGNW